MSSSPFRHASKVFGQVSHSALLRATFRSPVSASARPARVASDVQPDADPAPSAWGPNQQAAHQPHDWRRCPDDRRGGASACTFRATDVTVVTPNGQIVFGGAFALSRLLRSA